MPAFNPVDMPYSCGIVVIGDFSFSDTSIEHQYQAWCNLINHISIGTVHKKRINRVILASTNHNQTKWKIILKELGFNVVHSGINDRTHNPIEIHKARLYTIIKNFNQLYPNHPLSI